MAAAQCAEHVALAEKLRCDAEEAVALAKIHRDEGTTERRQLEAERERALNAERTCAEEAAAAKLAADAADARVAAAQRDAATAQSEAAKSNEALHTSQAELERESAAVAADLARATRVGRDAHRDLEAVRFSNNGGRLRYSLLCCESVA